VTVAGQHSAPPPPPVGPAQLTGSVLTVDLGRLGREPALALIGVAAPLLALLISHAGGLSPAWHTALEALIYAAAGLATAIVVRGDRLAPAILGLGQALLAVALSLGVDLDITQQTAIMTAVSIVVAAFVRTQVDAPLPPTPPVPTQLPAPPPPPAWPQPPPWQPPPPPPLWPEMPPPGPAPPDPAYHVADDEGDDLAAELLADPDDPERRR
jgi:hypothetical protein